MQRGYFDDFRDFRDKQGKIFHSPTKLIPAAAAPLFPPIPTITTDGSSVQLPLQGQPAFVCIAFRAGAQEMIEAWAGPCSRFLDDAGSSESNSNSNSSSNSARVQLVELALIDSAVMGMWPFKSMLMANGAKSQEQYAVPAQYLYYFGDTEAVRKSLHLTNKLTGYVFLVDGDGKVRWRGSGNPEHGELEVLKACVGSVGGYVYNRDGDDTVRVCGGGE